MKDQIECRELVIKDSAGRVRIRLGMIDYEGRECPAIEIINEADQPLIELAIAQVTEPAPNGEGEYSHEQPSLTLSHAADSVVVANVQLQIRGDEPQLALNKGRNGKQGIVTVSDKGKIIVQ